MYQNQWQVISALMSCMSDGVKPSEGWKNNPEADELFRLLNVYQDALNNPPEGVVGVGCIEYAEYKLKEAQSYMLSYLVVWRDDNELMQSKVNFLGDPETLTNNDWVALAAKSEGYSNVEVKGILERGYDLYLVCNMPAEFYDS